MTTPAAADTTVAPPPYEDTQVVGVACLLLALEVADARRLVFKPIARLGEDDRGGFVAATVMIDVGEGPLPFDLECVRLAATCLRFDPPFPGAVAIAVRLSLAADQAEASARRLMSALH
jgi:hypothetical protein